MKKPIGVVGIDHQTGEIIPLTILQTRAKEVYDFQEHGKDWMAMTLRAAEILSTVRIGEQAQRVMWALIARVEFENRIAVPQAELAEKLNMSRQEISAAMKKLVELGAIEQTGQIGTMKVWRINPAWAWRGKAKSHKEAMKNRKPRLKLVAAKE